MVPPGPLAVWPLYTEVLRLYLCLGLFLNCLPGVTWLSHEYLKVTSALARIFLYPSSWSCIYTCTVNRNCFFHNETGQRKLTFKL